MLFMKRTIAAMIVTLAFAGLARAEDANGKWNSEFDSGVGHQKYTFTLKVEGMTITGTAHRDVDGEISDSKLTDGKIDGDKITFVETLKRDDQDIRVEYKGTIKGDEITLTRAVGDFATNDIVAKRSTGSTTQPTTKP
jgi:hypothetical protein